MVESPVVRNALLLPLAFLFIFLPFLLLLAGVDLLAHWGPRAPAAGELLQLLSAGLRQALPAAACAALGLLVFRARRTAGSLFLSFLLLLGTALAVLYLGYAGSGRLEAGRPLESRAAEGRAPGDAQRSLESWLAAGRFNRTGGTVLYVEALGEGRVEGLVAVREESAAPRLGWSPRASVEWGKGRLRLRPARPAGSAAADSVGAEETPPVPTVNLEEPSGAALFRAGTLADRWAEDARVLDRELELRFRRGKASFLALAFALLFFLTSAFYLLRTARWPLLGAALGFLLLRGTFLLFAWFDGGLSSELRKLAPGAGWVSLLPVGMLLLAGALLLLLALLRPAPASPPEPAGRPGGRVERG